MIYSCNGSRVNLQYQWSGVKLFCVTCSCHNWTGSRKQLLNACLCHLFIFHWAPSQVQENFLLEINSEIWDFKPCQIQFTHCNLMLCLHYPWKICANQIQCHCVAILTLNLLVSYLPLLCDMFNMPGHEGSQHVISYKPFHVKWTLGSCLSDKLDKFSYLLCGGECQPVENWRHL